MKRARALRAGVVFATVVVAEAVLAWSPAARAQTEAAPRPDQQFDFMNLLTHHGLHDIEDETWNAYGQLTYISSWKLPFHAAYTNLNGTPNSLTTDAERSWTATATLYAGVRVWPGAEVYFAPEVIAEVPLSGLHGLGGTIQNFELQKNGSSTPSIYRSRAYLQQRFNLGGKRIVKESDPYQLAGVVDSRRITVHVGNFSAIDFMDKNTFSGDLRETFFNMAFMTYAAYDFAADARGYSWGGEAELYWDDWAIRIARLAAPQDPNQLALNFQLDKYYGDQAELEHQHILFGQPGAVRVLTYRNQENMGRFDEAIAAWRADPRKNAAAVGAAGADMGACPGWSYGSGNASAPDLCWVRRTNTKVGIGINVEQHITDDVGVFMRAMYSDGRTEVYSYTSTDRSLSVGGVAKGTPWHRPFDIAGAGVGVGWISKEHADFLKLGGVDGFIGDGNIDAAPETVLEAFYSFNLMNAVWLSADYQHIVNPGFNADRGPVEIVGARIHAEF